MSDDKPNDHAEPTPASAGYAIGDEAHGHE